MLSTARDSVGSHTGHFPASTGSGLAGSPHIPGTQDWAGDWEAGATAAR